MKIFVAGGTGAVGKRLVPLLVRSGHDVIATTRSPARTAALRAAGATPVVLDGLDREAVIAAIRSSKPEVVVHQMTDLAGAFRNLKRFDEEFASTNRLRTEGTQHLLDGARAAGTRLFVAQSYAGWYAPNGKRVNTEEARFEPQPPRNTEETVAAMWKLEQLVTGARDITGIVLRYGSFYGPGTSLGADGLMTGLLRKRQLPVIGQGGAVWSFLHVEDAAMATAVAIERGVAGIYNIADDEPADVAVWLPELAQVIGAPPPRRVPSWIGRMLVGEPGLFLMTRARGASNEKARRVLGWKPKYETWREGFRTAL